MELMTGINFDEIASKKHFKTYNGFLTADINLSGTEN